MVALSKPPSTARYAPYDLSKSGNGNQIVANGDAQREYCVDVRGVVVDGLVSTDTSCADQDALQNMALNHYRPQSVDNEDTDDNAYHSHHHHHHHHQDPPQVDTGLLHAQMDPYTPPSDIHRLPPPIPQQVPSMSSTTTRAHLRQQLPSLESRLLFSPASLPDRDSSPSTSPTKHEQSPTLRNATPLPPTDPTISFPGPFATPTTYTPTTDPYFFTHQYRSTPAANTQILQQHTPEYTFQPQQYHQVSLFPPPPPTDIPLRSTGGFQYQQPPQYTPSNQYQQTYPQYTRPPQQSQEYGYQSSSSRSSYGSSTYATPQLPSISEFHGGGGPSPQLSRQLPNPADVSSSSSSSVSSAQPNASNRYTPMQSFIPPPPPISTLENALGGLSQPSDFTPPSSQQVKIPTPVSLKQTLLTQKFGSRDTAIMHLKKAAIASGFSVLVRTSRPDYVVIICNCGRRVKPIEGERKRKRKRKTDMTGCEWHVILFRRTVFSSANNSQRMWEFRATSKMEHNHPLQAPVVEES